MWKIFAAVACAAAFAFVSSDDPQCLENQVYSNCSNAVCRALRCEERGINIPCPGVSHCDKSCVCALGFLTNTKGVCVEEERCDVGPVCPENQVYSNCTNALCRHQECYRRSKPIVCAAVSSCDTGCVCDVGYLRNGNGNCVKEELCD